MLIITILSIITALLVVTSTSTVYSVLWLVSTFLIVSALLGLLDLGFAALLYIIVYVGAIAILFLFVVQLLDLGSVSEHPVDQNLSNNTSKLPLKSRKGITPLSIVISISLLSILVLTTVVSQSTTNVWSDLIINNDGQILITYFFGIANINRSLLPIEVVPATLISPNSYVVSKSGSTAQVESIAEWFYGPGLLPLTIVSIILLVAMIAPIYLCKDND